MRPAQNLNAHTMKPHFHVKRKCYRCGSENHLANTCPHKESTCEKCKIKVHLSAVCRTGTRNNFRPAAQKFRSERLKCHCCTDQAKNPDVESDDENQVYYVNKFNSRDPVMVEIKVEGILMSFEIDTGSGLSIISEKTYRKFFSARKLEKSSIIVKTYSKERLNVLGFITVEAKLDSIKYPVLKLLVIAGNGINLLGRNWLHVIKLNWSSIFHRHSSCNNNISGVVTGEMSDGLKKLVNKHQAIFTDELGTIKELRAKLNVKNDANPKFCKARNVPFALKEAVENEIDRLEGKGILKSVSSSEWASPIVIVPKPDGRIRICGDYKNTANPIIENEVFPIPSPDELVAKMEGGKTFSKIDLTRAYM